MSIRYMEGFETIQQYGDLVARGGSPRVTTPLQVSAAPARYAGGKSLVRAYAGTQVLMDRSVGNIGNAGGMSLSFCGKLTSFNSTGTFPVRYFNGKWVARAYGNNPSAITITEDFRNWPAPKNITTVSSVAQDVIFDTTRNEYVVGAYTTSTANQFFSSADLNSSAWTASTPYSENPGASGVGKMYQDANGTLIFIVGSRIYNREVGAASAWAAPYTHGTAAFPYGAAATNGTRWIVPINDANRYVYSDDGGVTWQLSDVITNCAGRTIAFGNGTFVIGTNIAATPFAVSKDGGQTFTFPSVPVVLQYAGMYVAYGNGVFVGVPSQGTDANVYVSEDGLTWKVYPFERGSSTTNDLSFANGYFFLSQAGPCLAHSADGVNWSWNEVPSTTTSYTYSIAGFVGDSKFYHGFAINSDGSLYYRYPTGKGTFNARSVPGFQRDRWYNYECTITVENTTSINVSASIDGIPFDSRSVTWGLMSDSGPITYVNVGGGYGAWNGEVAVIPASSVGSIMYSTDRGTTTTLAKLPGAPNSAGSIPVVVWTGSRFLAFTTSGIYTSDDGINGWILIPGSPTGKSFRDADVSADGQVIIVVGHAAGSYYRSADGGNTWEERTGLSADYTYAGVAFLNGVWVAQPSPASGLRIAFWSNDGGLTWTGVSVPPAYNFGHAKSADRVLFTSNAGILIVTVPSAGEAPVFTSLTTGEGAPSNMYTIAYTGKYFIASGSQTLTIYYSENGTSWTSVNTSSNTPNTYTLGVGGAAIRYGGASSDYCTVVYPEFTDIPLRWYSNSYAFSALDDIVVTDFLQPNAGPQGEVQIRLMPSDTDVQAEWNPVPEDSPSNAAAATHLPLSQSSGTYVEANEVGQKDKYGTSSFTYPAGLRPLAMQVEAFYERVFTNTPTVKLGLQGNTEEVQTPDIAISSSLGQSTFVSKVIETNPDTGAAWTRDTINTTKLTNEKTG